MQNLERPFARHPPRHTTRVLPAQRAGEINVNGDHAPVMECRGRAAAMWFQTETRGAGEKLHKIIMAQPHASDGRDCGISRWRESCIGLRRQ
jgi:hypothetical protein